MIIVIGITGKKHAGKDTVAGIAAQFFRPQITTRLAFADELKQELAIAMGTTVQWIEEHKEDFRPLLQAWGTYKRDCISKTYWISKLLRKIIKLQDNVQVITIPDVRFINEAATVKQLNGYIIRVVRPSDVVVDNHVSEQEMDQIQADYGIVNDSSLHNLQQQTLNVLTNIKNKSLITTDYVYPTKRY